MEKERDSDRALQELFSLMPDEKENIPSGLNEKIMLEVNRTAIQRHKKKTFLLWSVVSGVSAGMFAGMIYIFRYLSIDFLDIFKRIFSDISVSNSGITVFWVFIGVIVLILLLIDDKFRKIFMQH